MTFVEFLRELKKKLNGSDSYRMTKNSVNFFLLKSRQLYEIDKNIIFDAICNDTLCNDPLSLRNLWNEKGLISNLRF